MSKVHALPSPPASHYPFDLSSLHRLPLPLPSAVVETLIKISDEYAQPCRLRNFIFSDTNIWYSDRPPSSFTSLPLPSFILHDQLRGLFSIFTPEIKQHDGDDKTNFHDAALSSLLQQVILPDPKDDDHNITSNTINNSGGSVSVAMKKSLGIASVAMRYSPMIADRIRAVHTDARLSQIENSADSNDISFTTMQLAIPKEKHDQVILSLRSFIPVKDDVSTLTVEDAPLVNDTWHYRSPFSLAYIQWLIENFPSACVRVDGQLVSWAIMHSDLSIGIMFTLESHRKRGYGSSVAAFLSVQLLERGLTPYCHVATGNKSSAKVFTQLGFTEGEQVVWIIASPPPPSPPSS
eukprot:TRINITY_DN11574_c0_g2_i1.p1 TRINITY_DN11574_c0_g2~~TRINITY_DN11574_c0_g2_i1.p1  ORF type:complete len:350 (+),score=60.25 TRINITY_DN11574_c0_g2_i1:97-1146(+)